MKLLKIILCVIVLGTFITDVSAQRYVQPQYYSYTDVCGRPHHCRHYQQTMSYVQNGYCYYLNEYDQWGYYSIGQNAGYYPQVDVSAQLSIGLSNAYGLNGIYGNSAVYPQSRYTRGNTYTNGQNNGQQRKRPGFLR